MAKERTLEGIRALKAEFGPSFHLHMYTSIPFRTEWATEFSQAGLDEIRFHLLDLEAEEYRDVIAACSEAGIETGVELPCEPDKEAELVELLEELRGFKINFLNLNELEITVGNHDNMELRGFNLSTEITAGAEGSSELAQMLRDRVNSAANGMPDRNDSVEREPYGFHVKFCTAVYKDAGQLRRRFERRGEATISPHEILTEDSTLMFGAVYASPDNKSDWIDEITEITGLPQRFMLWDSEEGRIELPLVIAESIADEVDAPVAMVEVTPTFDRMEVTVVWLNDTG